MRPTLQDLLGHGVVLLDGAMGSALLARGLADGEAPESWNLTHPDEVRAVHAGHVAAGSDVVQTNTFGANPFALARHGLEAQLEAINHAAVRLARAAAGNDRLVAGDIGPSGLLRPPLGDATPEALAEGFGRQAAALADAGADYIAVETMMDLGEAIAALSGARAATRLPVTVCLTFDRKPRGFFTLMGDRPEASVRALAEAGAVAVGANCSLGSADMVALCDVLLNASEVPIVAKPNAGLPELIDGRAEYRQSPDDFAGDVVRMAQAGARLVGGCCGTDGRHIGAVGAGLAADGLRAADGMRAADGRRSPDGPP